MYVSVYVCKFIIKIKQTYLDFKCVCITRFDDNHKPLDRYIDKLFQSADVNI